MPGLSRGAVLLRPRQLGVVWTCDGVSAVVLPVVELRRDGRGYAGDVPVERMDDLAVMGLGGVRLVVKAGFPASFLVASCRLQGQVSSVLACLISQARVRAHVAAGVEAKWIACRRTHHEHLAGERCVRL